MAETAPIPSSLDTIEAALTHSKGKCALAIVTLANLEDLEAQCGIESRNKLATEFHQRLQALLRPQDHFISASSDKAIIVFDELIDVHHLQLAGMKLHNVFAHPIPVNDQTAQFIVYGGFLYLARIATSILETKELLARAESALSQAKNQSQPNEPFHIATLDDESVVENHWQIGMRLREAMQAHHIYMDYQPKIDLDNGSLAGAEALVRWRDKGVVLPPADYLPALQADMMWELTVYCFRRVLRDILDYEIDFPISVNLDPVTLNEPELVPFLKRETSLWGVPPSQLILEITEVRDLENLSAAHSVLEELRDLKFSISIDDFGAGHSNLERLRELPMDELKIDRLFCNNIVADKQKQVMTKAVISLAQELGFTTVAEGIEDAESLELLRQWGCQQGQGFYLSAPLPIDSLKALYR